jgi:uncharacterized membrane protein
MMPGIQLPGATMTLLISGLILFLGIHLFPRLRGVRGRIIGRLGERAYQGVFSVFALVGLVLIVFGMARAPFVAVYSPPSWGKTPAFVLMPVSLMLLAAANMPTNLKRFTRHPMLWGVVLWSSVHLLANGDLASLMLFGAFGIYALVDMALANMQGLALGPARYPMRKDLMVVGAGIVAYLVLVFLHGYLFGVSLVGS